MFEGLTGKQAIIYLIIILLGVTLIFYLDMDHVTGTLVAIVFCVGLFITSRLFAAQNKAEWDKKYEEESKIHRSEWKQKRQFALQEELRKWIAGTNTIITEIPREIAFAEAALDKAEIEFKEGAFSPFWGAIESAVTHLAKYNYGIQKIVNSSRNYADRISREKEMGDIDEMHPAPQFQVDIQELPNAMATLDRMQTIIRLAQKDFQFSTIYEQRKTNKLLVGGFENMGEALSKIHMCIQSSVGDLSSSVADVADTVKRIQEGRKG